MGCYGKSNGGIETFLFTIMTEELTSESLAEEDDAAGEEDDAANEAEPESETTKHLLGHYVFGIVIVGESVQERDTVISPTIRFVEITDEETSSALPEIIVEERDAEDSDIDEIEEQTDTESVDISTTWTVDQMESPESLEIQETSETPENLEED